jgi:hypothetical protein
MSAVSYLMATWTGVPKPPWSWACLINSNAATNLCHKQVNKSIDRRPRLVQGSRGSRSDQLRAPAAECVTQAAGRNSDGSRRWQMLVRTLCSAEVNNANCRVVMHGNGAGSVEW